MWKFKMKYIQHWWLEGGITAKEIWVIAPSWDHAKIIIELDLRLGGVY